MRARGVVDTGELSGSRLRLVVDLGVVHLLADAKHHAELALSGLGVGFRAGLPLGAAALGDHALARAARAARAGGRRGRAKRGPELRNTQEAQLLVVRGDARGALALVRRQPLHARAREEWARRSARVAPARVATRAGPNGKKAKVFAAGEREGKKRVVRCARGRRAHAHRRARRRPPSRRSRSCAAGREGARRARARSVVARGNSPRNIVSSQEKPSSVITRASCVRSPSRPECGLAPPDNERATRRARVPSERCPRRTPDTREVEPKEASRVSKERFS